MGSANDQGRPLVCLRQFDGLTDLIDIVPVFYLQDLPVIGFKPLGLILSEGDIRGAFVATRNLSD